MSRLARQSFTEFDPTAPLFAEKGFQALFDHWSALRQADTLPASRDLSPRVLAPYLHNMIIQEVHSPAEIRYRLVGTSVVARLGIDPTGQNLLDFVTDEMHRPASLLFQLVVGHPCGAMTSHTNILGNGRALKLLSLYLPLATKDNIPRVVSMHTQEEVVDYVPPPGRVKIGSALHAHAWIDLGYGQPEILAATVT